ncbi:hypothetical protein J2M54_07190 [Arthrobacter sp. zg-ZUI227]|nr:hypothetical protein [Arthrobacter jiangjiafuii]
MIGTPDPNTRHVITYVPGTFTGMTSFYTGPITGNGVVWDGNSPIHRDEFDQNFYRGPDDDELDGAINSIEEGNILMDNHSLIASNSDDNMKALENMLKIVTR